MSHATSTAQARRVKAGIFVSSLQDMGGAVRVAVSLANRMAEDYDVTVFELTGHDRLAFPVDGRVSCVPLGAEQQRLRGRVGEVKRKLGEALREHPVDVMLGIGAEETAVAVLPCRKAGIALAFCDHGAIVNQLDSRSTTLLRYLCARFCQVTVSLTEQNAADYRSRFHIPEDRVVTIANWIPRGLMDTARQCDASSKRLLWAGRLDREKGVDHLFEIASLVLPDHPDWVWDVYGSQVLGDGGFDLAARVEEAGLSAQVRLCGVYSDAREVFPSHSIGTLTSYREGLPLFLLEGSAFGLPLVSFDIDTGPRDIIDDGCNGRLVAPYDCEAYARVLGELMDSAELRRSMSVAARKRAERFSEDAIYERWKALIDRLAG